MVVWTEGKIKIGQILGGGVAEGLDQIVKNLSLSAEVDIGTGDLLGTSFDEGKVIPDSDAAFGLSVTNDFGSVGTARLETLDEFTINLGELICVGGTVDGLGITHGGKNQNNINNSSSDHFFGRISSVFFLGLKKIL